MDKTKIITVLTSIAAVIAATIGLLQSNTAVETAERTEYAVERGVSPSTVVSGTALAE